MADITYVRLTIYAAVGQRNNWPEATQPYVVVDEKGLRHSVVSTA